MSHAVAAVRGERRVTRALLPQWVARLLGLAALGAIGAFEWQRLVAGLSYWHALSWVAVAGAAAVAVLLSSRIASPRQRAFVLGIVAAARCWPATRSPTPRWGCCGRGAGMSWFLRSPAACRRSGRSGSRTRARTRGRGSCSSCSAPSS